MIYGSGSKNLGEIKIDNESCPNCKENTIFLHGFAKYFHIFWIPIFPVYKKKITVCHSCEVEIPKKERSQSLKDKVELEKSNFKTPLYLFAGLIIILSLIAYLEFNSRKHKDFVKDRINHLEENDVIVFKQSSSEYSFAKVEEVKNDTVYFVNSNYSLNQIPSLTDYIAGLEEKEDFFSEEVYLYSQKEIVSLNSIGEIDIFEIKE